MNLKLIISAFGTILLTTHPMNNLPGYYYNDSDQILSPDPNNNSDNEDLFTDELDDLYKKMTTSNSQPLVTSSNKRHYLNSSEPTSKKMKKAEEMKTAEEIYQIPEEKEEPIQQPIPYFFSESQYGNVANLIADEAKKQITEAQITALRLTQKEIEHLRDRLVLDKQYQQKGPIPSSILLPIINGQNRRLQKVANNTLKK